MTRRHDITREQLSAIMSRTPTPTKQQAADELGCSMAWVSQLLDRWNLPRRGGGQRRPHQYRRPKPKREATKTCLDLIHAFRERCKANGMNHEHELARILCDWLERH